MAKLTDKQQLFCEQYLIDLNATQAAIRAGYSEKTAASIGNENLIKPEIQNYIQERQKALQSKLEITQERVLQEYAKIAFIDIRKFYNEAGKLLLPHELSDDAAAAISGIDVDEIWGFDVELESKVKQGETKKVKMHNKLAALDAIGKHLGFFEKDNEQSKVAPIFKTVVKILPSSVPIVSDEKDVVL